MLILRQCETKTKKDKNQDVSHTRLEYYWKIDIDTATSESGVFREDIVIEVEKGSLWRGGFPRHHALNDMRRVLIFANVPCTLKASGLSHSDGKQPDGLTLILWQRGCCLIWDSTRVNTFAAFHLSKTSRTVAYGAESDAK
ncbi:hypothetical protein EVAR_91048_1 [Eumeta japonica]|uniref:Uncharacterized protein n=1 Tax=Eumeta variegata TaxID=151549 RepID=A0A4C1Z9T3_EUMVA|nr:hypothetical protein EVAR_91048_1 [Eumeta japonica]